jgi:hypothetical protein
MARSDEAGESTGVPKPKKQRRKRKLEVVAAEPSVSSSKAADLKGTAKSVAAVSSSSSPPPPPTLMTPLSTKAVQLEVLDVRDVVAGRQSRPSSSPVTSADRSLSTATSFKVNDSNTEQTQASRGSEDDAFARLLLDARQMQGRVVDSEPESSSSKGTSLPGVARSAISTLITVDFFLICGFLLWFLAGIFASNVLQNDSVQIAFNGIFQPVVQPALGVLMIGSIASAVFKGEDDDGKGEGN